MTTHISFLVTPNTTIDTIGAGNYGGITAQALQASDPRFTLDWWGGSMFLCTTADLSNGGVTLTGNNGQYSVEGKAHTLVVALTANAYVGGHPPYVPKPTK